MGSILTSTKKLLGILGDYEEFDVDIIININSAFMTLHQLGVGPKECFTISGSEETWDEFFEGRTDLEAAKTFVYLKTRLAFDPPTTSFVLSSMENQIKELEYRLLLQAKGGDDGGEGDDRLPRTSRHKRHEMGCS